MLKKFTHSLWGLLLIPFLAFGATDNFTRADAGTLGGLWVAQTGNEWGIVSNHAVPNSFNPTLDYYNSTFSNDQCSKVVITTIGGGVGPAVRASTVANSYIALVTEGSVTFLRLVLAGIETTLEDYGTTASNGDTLELCVTGTTYVAYKNAVQIGDTPDITLSTGKPAMFGYGSNNSVASWEGRDAAAGLNGRMFLIF